ncbi:hypothetical protein JR316_0011202 [Psilocybe cubensis]|uniref:Ecp2 effector protein domain-containing protein n=2 Tax=Psilocybe cubensis TaxID=181762 RepID=A0A8H8CHU3_PSICU|nr:hypothetical protein JR316_0011202 [Psilocybe cubensis]KAH9475647.1 hypothetical protein JR316_0011202 [Psilocybe cubensis]
MFAFTSLVALVSTTITLVHSSPTVYPDVIPGPGLPSLEFLNLTSKDLYTMTPPTFDLSLNSRSANFDAEWYDDNSTPFQTTNRTSCSFTFTTGDVDNTIACFNYLVSIGNNACVVSADNVEFCRAGDASIGGSNLHQTSGAASSACRDVATAVQWIFTNCNVGGRVGGADAAYGNGDLVVGVYNVDWI